MSSSFETMPLKTLIDNEQSINLLSTLIQNITKKTNEQPILLHHKRNNSGGDENIKQEKTKDILKYKKIRKNPRVSEEIIQYKKEINVQLQEIYHIEKMKMFSFVKVKNPIFTKNQYIPTIHSFFG